MKAGQQQELFDSAAPPWELDDRSEALVASVLLSIGPTEPLDYLVPASLYERVRVGCRVSVPLGHSDRTRIGYCVALTHQAVNRRLKELAAVVDEQCLLSPTMFRLSKWMAERYLCTWTQALDTMLPAAVRHQAGTRRATILSVPAEVISRLEELKLPAKQLLVLRYLVAAARPVLQTAVMETLNCTTAPIMALRRKGLLQADIAAHQARGLRQATSATRRESCAQRRSAAGPSRDHGRPGSEAAANDRAARHYGQRQDRGLHPRHPGNRLVRSASDRAGAGDQPHAADRTALSGSLRRSGSPAQPYDRCRARLALGADCATRSRSWSGAQRRLCAGAAIGVDCARRRARSVFQAG